MTSVLGSNPRTLNLPILAVDRLNPRGLIVWSYLTPKTCDESEDHDDDDDGGRFNFSLKTKLPHCDSSKSASREPINKPRKKPKTAQSKIVTAVILRSDMKVLYVLILWVAWVI